MSITKIDCFVPPWISPCPIHKDPPKTRPVPTPTPPSNPPQTGATK